MIDVGHSRSLQRNVGRSWLTTALTGALAMGVLAAIPGSANASQAPKDLGTKAASLLPSAPVKPGFAVTVRRAIATTTTLTSSHNPSKKGHSVTFTATVTATGTNILPTGTVVFRDGSKDLGTTHLEGVAQATYSTSSLDEGSHNITAFYQGNTAFDPSTSPVLIQKVEDDGWDKNRDHEDWKRKHEEWKKKKEEDRKHEEWEKDQSDDDEEEDDTSTVRHDDDDLARLCRHFKDHDFDHDDHGTSSHHDRAREELRRRCDKWHHKNNDWITVINKGHRRHIEGYFDKGGGHREYWDAKHQRWVPIHKHYEKPYKKVHKKRHYMPKPAHHFAVTG